MEQNRTKSFVERTSLQCRFSRMSVGGGLIDAIGGQALQGSGFEYEQPEAGFDDSEHREEAETGDNATVPVSPTGQDSIR